MTTGALKAPFDRWAGLRTWVPNTPALWPSGEATSADCILPLLPFPSLCKVSLAVALTQIGSARATSSGPHSSIQNRPLLDLGYWGI